MTALTRPQLLDRFHALGTWERRGERAPHKPLLVLLALARVQQGADRLLAYEEIEPSLKKLLGEFGPARDRHHPEYPFWYLRNDQVWEVPEASAYSNRTGGSSPSRKQLLERHAAGGFTPDAYGLLRSDPTLVRDVAQELLDEHFPESYHEAILEAVGLDLGTWARRVPRDPAFRAAVLQAYGRSCAVCGFDGHLSTGPFCLDAAHVMWKQAGGPDEVANGISMCVLHHRAFDRGAFTIEEDLRLSISSDLTGSSIRVHFLDLHGQRLREPHAEKYRPRVDFLRWHREQVFHHPARGA